MSPCEDGSSSSLMAVGPRSPILSTPPGPTKALMELFRVQDGLDELKPLYEKFPASARQG